MLCITFHKKHLIPMDVHAITMYIFWIWKWSLSLFSETTQNRFKPIHHEKVVVTDILVLIGI